MFSEDQPIYRDYATAKAAVDREVMDECPELATAGELLPHFRAQNRKRRRSVGR